MNIYKIRIFMLIKMTTYFIILKNYMMVIIIIKIKKRFVTKIQKIKLKLRTTMIIREEMILIMVSKKIKY